MIEPPRLLLLAALWLALASACGRASRDRAPDTGPHAGSPSIGGEAGCEAFGCDQTCAEKVASFAAVTTYKPRFERGECVTFTYYQQLPQPGPVPADAHVATPAQEFQRPGCRCLSPVPGTPPWIYPRSRCAPPGLLPACAPPPARSSKRGWRGLQAASHGDPAGGTVPDRPDALANQKTEALRSCLGSFGNHLGRRG
jgi:hypothetical protein